MEVQGMIEGENGNEAGDLARETHGEESTSDSTNDRKLFHEDNAGLLLSSLLVVVGIYLILISGKPPLKLHLGDVARKDHRAEVAFESVDIDRTRRLREEAQRQVPAVFHEFGEQHQASVKAFLSAVEKGESQAIRQLVNDEAIQDDIGPLLKTFRQQSDALRESLNDLGRHTVVLPEEWEEIHQDGRKSLVIVEGEETEKEIDPDSVVLLEEEDDAFASEFADCLESLSDEERQRALTLLARALEPNVRLDREATVSRENRAAAEVEPVTIHFPQGAVILKQGTEVRRQQLENLRAARRSYEESSAGRRDRLQKRVGLAVILLVLVGAAGYYIYTYRADLMRSRLQRVSFGVMTLLMVGIARWLVVSDMSLLLTPVPLVVMVMCLVYDQRFGFEMAVFYALLVGLAQRGDALSFVVLMLGSMTAAFLTGFVRRRGTLIKAGLFVGAVHWAAAIGFGLLTGDGNLELNLHFWRTPLFIEAGWGLVNGVMTGFLVSGLLPAIERLFGVTTDIRLLEWSDPNQPLLQRLLLEAPGTYHHSMLVGSLAADAAEAVGANRLLARVSAYFHDIGKLKKPEYFSENIPEDTKNPHDDLAPTMSKLILTAHPRDGADMARKEGMPPEVQRVIMESHGSTLTRFFWNRAKEEAADNDKEQPAESTFRYRLPKPTSKEAACVMLADSAEGATRALESPSTKKVEENVHEIIMERLHDGQLDESGLTITDLKRVEETLVRGINAMFHKRIRYPDQEGELQGKENNGETSDRD
ncbi:MAG: HD family phosphohydrolase [Planctomycetota bacterium]